MAQEQFASAASSWKAYSNLIGLPEAVVLATDHVHTELSNILSHGFVPRLLLDDYTPGDAISALHWSFKTVLEATNCESIDDYRRIRLTEAMERGLDEGAVSYETHVSFALNELDRLVAMQRADGNYYFPACQLGVLTFTQDGESGELSAVIHERESADCTVWLFNDVCERPVGPTWSNWFAFSESQVPDEGVPILTSSSQPANDDEQGGSQVSQQHDLQQRCQEPTQQLQPSWQPMHPFTQAGAAEYAQSATAPPHAGSQVEDLFTAGPDGLVGSTLLQLAEHYSNSQILAEIAERWPDRKVKHVNVLTKRLTAAVHAESAKTGVSREQVRVNLALARKANGVSNKARLRIEGGPQDLRYFT